MQKIRRVIKAPIFWLLILNLVGTATGWAALVVTNTNDSGVGSLRQAITSANAAPGSTISFNISTGDAGYSNGVWTIQPATNLPDITANGTIIDGTSQPGYTTAPVVALSGTASGHPTVGLNFNGAATGIVRGLVINSFSNGLGYGIEITGPSATGNLVQGCYLGTSATGAAALPNNFGIYINNSANNVIGGTTAAARNVISGNTSGVGIFYGAAGNLVEGNYIGLDATGTVPLPNTSYGITIFAASNNTIGGTTTTARNVISGNSTAEIALLSGASSNSVTGNYIGPDATGAALANYGDSGFGLYLDNAPSNMIGGTTTGMGNLISGNGSTGIYLIETGTTNTIVQGNRIGTNAAGTSDLGNRYSGIDMYNGTQNNTVGGTTANARNLISGNGGNGIYINGNATNVNTVMGNYLGTDVTGSAAIANDSNGIFLTNGAASNTIGGTAAGAGNLISGNGDWGIRLEGSNSNVTQGNNIGTNAAGTAALGNGAGGIALYSGAQNNTVGGTTTSARNLISGNQQQGIYIGDNNTTGNLVQGNYIGTNINGVTAIANNDDGIIILNSAASNTIGGTAAGAGNLISGNSGNGVQITSAAATGNVIQGNDIGTNATVTSGLPNTGDGVLIVDASNNTIGGTGNVIAFNKGGGVVVTEDDSVNNSIRGNSIHDNQYAGIDLGGDDVTLNDAGDADTGPNNLQNFPVITNASVVGGNTVVAGTLNSTANSNFNLDLYASNSPDPAGFGEGQNFAGSTAVTTDGSGNATFSITLTGLFTGQYFTATATDNSGNTSEFSQTTPISGSSVVTNTLDTGAGSLRDVIRYANAHAGTTITFNIPTSDAGYTNNVWTIHPATNLPDIRANGTVIDGTSQPGFSTKPVIVLSGASAAQLTLGLNFNGAANCTVKNLTINGFDNGVSYANGVGYGIEITGSNATGNVIRGCFIGTDATGTVAVPNNFGIYINNAPNNTIGGATASARNLISGNQTNSRIGVNIAGANATDNLVTGNYIGTDITGTVDLGNDTGIWVQSGASSNTLGGAATGAGNLISSNGVGIRVADTGTNNTLIQGNQVGTTVAGNSALGNGYAGIFIYDGAQNTVVGGSTTNARNLVSGNNNYGIDVSDGGTTGTVIRGNYIGTDITGGNSVANNDGIYLGGGTANNTLGGTITGAGNLISGNSSFGVFLGGAGVGNAVQGNYIGTNAAGTAALGNGTGVGLDYGTQNATVGGTTASARNLISGNLTQGVYIANNSTSGNLVQGNYIGTDSSGSNAIANSGDGVFIGYSTLANTIGGTVAGAGNVISANGGSGIRVTISGTDNNIVQGNYIGTNAAGTAALGNSGAGITVDNGSQNTIIGGASAGARNLISANRTYGVAISDNTTTGTNVQGNYIGLDAGGTNALGNSLDGINVSGGSLGNSFLGNSIFNSGGLGINLQPAGEPNSTVTANHAGGVVSGPNHLQNYPVITNITTFSGTTTISGTFNSVVNTTFILNFFRNSVADSSGYGEGQFYLGSQDITTDSNGNALFSFSASGVFSGQFFTSTATNKTTGDTSEFSQNQTSTAAVLGLSVAATSISESAGVGAATGTVTRNTFSGVALVVNLSSNNSRVNVPAQVTIPAGATTASFTLGGVDNNMVDGTQTVTISAAATGLPAAAATLQVTDNDTAGVTVTPTSGLVTTKAGGTATFKLVLTSQPGADVAIGLSSSNTTAGTVAPGAVTFSAANWNVPQTVTVTGVDDNLANGNQTYTIVTTPATSNDVNYRGYDAADVSVVNLDNHIATLALNAKPATIAEGAATTLTLTRNTPISVALVVNLSSSDNNSLPVPGTVTIPAGAASVTFQLVATDDSLVNGPRSVTITASQSGFIPANAVVTVTDNDVFVPPTPTPAPTATPTPAPALTLTLSPTSISEAAGLSAAHGTITREHADLSQALTVAITSNNPGKARPALTSVTIPSGVATATFAIDALDNTLVDGTQTVTFTAAATGFPSGTAAVNVTDNDVPTLALTVTPDRFNETAGTRAATGTVTRNTPTDKPLEVQLSSSNINHAKVPVSVTIPAGAISAKFFIAAVSDSQPNGSSRVTLSARASSYVAATAEVTVLDTSSLSNLTLGGTVQVNTTSVPPGANAAIGGATVSLLHQGIVLDRVLTDATGHYQFQRLPVGTYTVTVKKDSYTSFAPASQTVSIVPKRSMNNINFVGTPRGSLSGRVIQRLSDGTIKPLTGVTVNAYSDGGTLSTRTTSLGAFSFTTTYLTKWTLLPIQRGTYFKPVTLMVPLTPTTPTQSGLNFETAGADTLAPTITVLTPRPSNYTLTTQPTRATGTATDKGGAGVAAVTVALAQFSSATATTPLSYWNWQTGRFGATSTTPSIERLATGTTSWALTGLPTLPAGFYGLRATAVDGAGNSQVSVFVRYGVTGTTTRGEGDTPAPPLASMVKLSSAGAQASTASVQLRFTGALDAEVVSDANHYTVTINGQTVNVASAAYNARSFTVTLALPDSSLALGDSVVVQWSGLLDSGGKTLNGQPNPFVVR